MGWTEYSATKFNTKGNIDRKAECDAYFLEGLNRGFYEIKKSRIIGSTYYAAVTPLKRYKRDADGKYIYDSSGRGIIEEIPVSDRETFGYVMLTSVDNNKCRFAYKPISEDMGPAQRNCPDSILDCLSPTSNSFAAAWRKECRDNNSRKKLSSLPVGTEIEFEYNGKTIRLRKSAPRYQFKKDFWIVDSTFNYWSKKRIPSDYKIV